MNKSEGKEVLILILLKMRGIVNTFSLIREIEAADEKGNEVGVLHPGASAFSISGARRRAVLEVLHDLRIPKEREKDLIQMARVIIEKEAGRAESNLEENEIGKMNILGIVERAALRLAGIRTVYNSESPMPN